MNKTPVPATELFNVELYKDKAGNARWRLVSTFNGKTVGTIGEGNFNLSHVRRMVNRIFGVEELQLVRNILGQALLSLDRAEQKERINEALHTIARIQKRVVVKKYPAGTVAT